MRFSSSLSLTGSQCTWKFYPSSQSNPLDYIIAFHPLFLLPPTHHLILALRCSAKRRTEAQEFQRVSSLSELILTLLSLLIQTLGLRRELRIIFRLACFHYALFEKPLVTSSLMGREKSVHKNKGFDKRQNLLSQKIRFLLKWTLDPETLMVESVKFDVFT